MTTRPSLRSAFTLVELLIVMTVIGILVGLLASAVIPAMTRSSEFAIQTEVMQLERSLENFKTKYGFYPPSFKNISSGAELLPYMNRIAPNHGLGNGNDGGELELWWDEVGSLISSNPGSDLVFWLAGLNKNKQMPISRAAGEKEVFYDFKNAQLYSPNPGTVPFAYLQPRGKQTPILYLDAGSYAPTPGTSGNATADGGYEDGSWNYYNPNSFQLITWGMDGLPGESVLESGGTGSVRRNIVGRVGDGGTDNITNFAEGRLERVILGTN